MVNFNPGFDFFFSIHFRASNHQIYPLWLLIVHNKNENEWAFYAFYSYLNSNFELAPVYLNPASSPGLFPYEVDLNPPLLIGLPGIRPRSISVFKSVT